jgi:hypothetical protein
MEDLRIDAKYDTPKVILSKIANIVEISGRSIPEDAGDFYKPVVEWVERYSQSPNPSTTAVFKLDYINTASSRMIQNILLQLRRIEGINIQWFFKEDDQDMEEAGQDFAQLIDFPIEIRVY